jgi:hypothetical protein
MDKWIVVAGAHGLARRARGGGKTAGRRVAFGFQKSSRQIVDFVGK